MKYHLDDLVDSREISKRLHVGKAAVSNWKKRHKSFPEPVKSFPRFDLYYWPDVKEWYGKRVKFKKITK